jgi:arylsulfatase A-like enzyme
MNVLLVTIDTLRADHLGAYGYRRATSPRIDAFAKGAVVFDDAYTFWPKTRGSFVAMLTGRRDSLSGYGKSHPMLLDFNPTLAEVLRAAGYQTAAVVDNGNVAARHGYAKGFDTYRETWQEKELPTEMDRTRAISAAGAAFFKRSSASRPFFLWLHYVNPHAPYTPPAPYDTAFLDEQARSGPRLAVVPGFHGGIPRQWAVPGQDRLGYYVAQYDGEIAAVDEEVGRMLEALRASGAWDRTLVVLTSDHGESLGEHGYYFDHGEDLFDPSLRIPLIVSYSGALPGRNKAPASTLDIVPTILDALKVSYPPELSGRSLLGAVRGQAGGEGGRLFARNDRNLNAAWDGNMKIVATPQENGGWRFALYDRLRDPGEGKDVSGSSPADVRGWRRELELFLERSDREWARTRGLLEGVPAPATMSIDACENLKALGYVGVAGCPATPDKEGTRSGR